MRRRTNQALEHHARAPASRALISRNAAANDGIARKGSAGVAFATMSSRLIREQPQGVQRLFSTFPSGPSGIGLLLLRVSVAVGLALSFAWHQGIPLAVVVVSWLVCAVLCIGYYTPVAALAAFVIQGVLLCIRLISFEAGAVVLLDALALALLGAGAYSLDARRFGRPVPEVNPLKEP